MPWINYNVYLKEQYTAAIFILHLKILVNYDKNK